jgi:ABC-type transport system involved in multi-copper enzyme maturation permease subunit
VSGGLSAIWALALTTFREAMRNKLLYTILAFACVLILSSWAVGQLSLHEEARVARDMGLGGIFFFGVVLSIVGGVTLVYQEIQRKTVYALIPKPIHRAQFIVGKYAGLSLTLAVQMGLMSLVLCLALLWQRGAPDGALARAIVLLYVEVLVVTAVAVLFSSFSTPLLSGLYTAGITLCGIFIPELRAIIAARLGDAPALATAARAATAALPDLHLFFVSGAEQGGRHVSVHAGYVGWGYVAATSTYGIAYAACVLLLASVVFSRRDFV